VTLDVQELPAAMQIWAWRGHLTIHADWQSPASRYVRQVVTVLVREFGF
jgi:hypothetical protein